MRNRLRDRRAIIAAAVVGVMSWATGCDSGDGVGQAIVTGVIRDDTGPIAGARVRMTRVDAPVETESGSITGVSSEPDGCYILRFFAYASSADALGDLTVTAPAGSGLRDTVVRDVVIRIRTPAGTTIRDVILSP